MPLFDRAGLDDATRIVRAHVPPTPQYPWPLLAEEVGAQTWVKHENHTPTSAFKIRGGLVLLDTLRRTGFTGPLVSATRGNHGQSLSLAGRLHGVPVTIVVPEGNDPDQVAAMRGFGAEVIVHGHDFQEALEHAMAHAEHRGLVPVPAFHADLVAGVATGALELQTQAGRLDSVYLPVGQGSGICAHMAVRDLLGVGTEVVGVVADRAPAHALSFAARRPVSTPNADTFVDGVATRTPVPDAVEAMVAGAARFVRVTEAQAEHAMRILWQTTHQMPEPAGALALAGLLADTGRDAGATAGVVMTGGNCDTELIRRLVVAA